jgi:HAD superfamily hydrolase (TIGR01509 family)
MSIRALVFDFDGLILDTESVVYHSWEHVYREHDVALPMDLWLGAIGSDDSSYDPLAYLLAHRPELDVDGLHARRRAHRDVLLGALEPAPGVIARLDEAAARGLRLAVASSSEPEWVQGHLERVGLHTRFALLRCREDVARVKPDPALYRSAAEALGVDAGEAVAFEDSPHGVAAARAAGMRCVAVPGPMTSGLDFEDAQLCLSSLAEQNLDEILAELTRR